MPTFAAVDLGASGGRVMAGIVEDRAVRLEAVHRFENGVRKQDGHLRWDFERLYHEVLTGLGRVEGAQSIGIDTWGVDYGLLDEAGQLLAPPIAYRDQRTAKVIDDVHAAIPPAQLYAINGLQHLPFNTLYQLRAEQLGPLWDRAAHVALLPDLIAHRLTGQLRTEATNASTTGLLDACTHDWSLEVLAALGIDAGLLPDVQPPARVRGRTSDGVLVTTVGSHDTASAVVGVPATTERFAYIASGTWSLVGLELPAPVLTEAARVANFTNELGVGGRTRFLRNVGGLWLLQESMRTWRRSDLDRLLAEAAALPAGGPRIDVDDDAFIPPDAMPERIATAAGRPGMSEAETVRCILDSLAAGYARTIHQAAALANRTVEVVHVVGGGSQNELLCQLTADAVGIPVIAGPVEATALGNVLVQAQAHGAVAPTLEAVRERLATWLPLRRYEPS